jgi:ribosomal protein S18 acetylase RimI-like enzyme
MEPAAVTLRRLTDPADPALAAAERIYLAALPPTERKPTAWLRSLPTRPEYRLTVAEHGDDVIGLAVTFVPSDPSDAALLEYLAVAADARGGGVGGELFGHVIGSLGRPLLVEVERDDADADRRRAFYRRHGCRAVVGLDYQLPLPGAPPMELMVAGAAVVRRAQLARWLATVYADVYGQRRDDPRVAATIAALADPVRLE